MNEIAKAQELPATGNEVVDSVQELTVQDLSTEAQTELKHILEGVLFASNKPLTAKQLHALFPEYEAPTIGTIKELLTQLMDDYATRGVRLVEISSGYCFRVAALAAPYISELTEEKAPRYSRALLETLAIIAYRQPITRGEIEQIRGVAVSSHIFKTIQERDWIRVVGTKDVPGKPALFGTTKTFLDYFNLKKLSDLPELTTLVEPETPVTDESVVITEEALMVAEKAMHEEAEILDEAALLLQQSMHVAKEALIVDES